MKSLKEIIKEKENILNQKDYTSDKYIIMTWIEENFGLDIIDFIIFIFKNQLEKFNYLNKKYIEHQSWNASVFSQFVVDKLYETYKEKGGIEVNDYSLFISLLRMYMDGNWDYNNINPNLKEIIKNCFMDEKGEIQINDPQVVAYIKEGMKK